MKTPKNSPQMMRIRFEGEFDFPLLEDKDHKVINRYGIFNPDGRGWPHPATYISTRRASCAGSSSRSITKSGRPTNRFAGS